MIYECDSWGVDRLFHWEHRIEERLAADGTGSSLELCVPELTGSMQ